MKSRESVKKDEDLRLINLASLLLRHVFVYRSYLIMLIL